MPHHCGMPSAKVEFMGVTVDIAQLVTCPEITAVLGFPGDTYRLAEIHRAEERAAEAGRLVVQFRSEGRTREYSQNCGKTWSTLPGLPDDHG